MWKKIVVILLFINCLKANEVSKKSNILSLISHDKSSMFRNICFMNIMSRYRYEYPYKNEYIPTDVCTHLFFGNAAINDLGAIVYSYPWSQEEADDLQQLFTMKGRGVLQHIYLSVGGPEHSGYNVGNLYTASTNSTNYISNTNMFIDIWRRIFTDDFYSDSFITSLEDILKNFDFTGINLNYHFPQWPSNNDEEMEQYIKFIKKLRESFKPSFNIAISIQGGKSTSKLPIKKILEYVDYINIVDNVDFYYNGINSRVAGNNYKTILHDSINQLKEYDLKAFNFYLPLHGQGYKVNVVDYYNKRAASALNEITVKGSIRGLNFSNLLGYVTFAELCILHATINRPEKFKSTSSTAINNDETSAQLSNTLNQSFFIPLKEDTIESCGSWITNNLDESNLLVDLISYTDVLDVQEIVDVIRQNHIGGLYIQNIDEDDYLNACNFGNSSLINSINRPYTPNKKNVL
uniref:GH18 domain-containing protein n=1 Tax=Drosophila-associated filamentous virus TaxID=2743186 RepID=A0A6M9U0Y9_9VIRU|nr:putative protein 48 [Drosophila-associated filamentous virus]